MTTDRVEALMRLAIGIGVGYGFGRGSVLAGLGMGLWCVVALLAIEAAVVAVKRGAA